MAHEAERAVGGARVQLWDLQQDYKLTMTAVRAAEAKQAVAAEKPAAKGPANGNGHGHGNGNGQMAASRLG